MSEDVFVTSGAGQHNRCDRNEEPIEKVSETVGSFDEPSPDEGASMETQEPISSNLDENPAECISASECLLNRFLRPPRENSGSRTSNRYDFQKDWTICRILELHIQSQSYLVICDYHEDVVVLNGEDETADLADFYQIKTDSKGGKWTLRALLKKDGNASILGKLYSNFTLAGDSTKSLNFVSNAKFGIDLGDGSDSASRLKFTCQDLHESEVKRINNSLEEECNGKCNLPLYPLLRFEVTPISYLDSATYTKGKIAEFFEELNLRPISVTPLYRTLFDEVRSKTNYEGIVGNQSELRNRKAIGRSDIQKLIAEAAECVDTNEIWDEVRERLVKENMPFLKARSVGLSWRQYEVDRMDATNESLQQLRKRIRAWASMILEKDNDISLTELGEQVFSSVMQARLAGNYLEPYILAITFMETYEEPTVPQANTKSQEETP